MLSNLTRLVVLELAFCNLTGDIPQGLIELRKLSRLHLSHNQLTGPFPAFIGNLSELSFLVLESNSLTGSVPTTVGNSRSLNIFSIGWNFLHGGLDFLPILSNCRQLQALDISVSFFTGNLPDYLGNFSSKLSLFLAFDNELTGNLPASLSNLSSLSLLDLSYNQISSLIPESIMTLKNLRMLDFSMNFQVFCQITLVTSLGCSILGCLIISSLRVCHPAFSTLTISFYLICLTIP